MSDSSFSPVHEQARSLSRMAYTDVGALGRVRGNDRAALEQAAEQFESLFVDIWLSSMRKAGAVFGEGNYLSSSAVETHQEMLDHQWAVHVSESGGVGLKEVLMRQLARSAPDAEPPVPGGALERAPGSAPSAQPASAESTMPTESPAESPVESPAESSRPAAEAQATGGFKDALFEGAQRFVNELEPVVRRIAGASGLHPVAVLAQAALETGWGASVPHDGEGQPSFNLFGIKANGWQGPSVDVTTLEHQFGRFVRKVESFRAYDDVGQAMQDYVSLLTGSERYAPAMKVAQDPAAFADALQEAGYATDPGYADKLKALQRQISSMLGNAT